MKINFRDILLIYCVCRQAERSIDFSLRDRDGLKKLREYFCINGRNRKVKQAIQIVDIEEKSPSMQCKMRDYLYRCVLLPIGVRGKWRWISARKIKMVKNSLLLFSEVLDEMNIVNNDQLIKIRTDLYACQVNLRKEIFSGRKLVSIAQSVEHYGQNHKIKFQPIEEILRMT